jgi:pimeloyl-ACP methyl ester carboxylesterase
MRPLVVLCASFLASALVLAQQVDIGPAPGRLIDIGGRKLHLNCTGRGSPTVILEAGASSFALDWSLVQPEIARVQRVCSYDRAGSGWSDPRADVETPARVVADLHAALAAAAEEPPFVMVGASAGGIYVRIYQLDHPDEVVGLVLVDPATEDRLFTMFRGQAVTISSLTSEQLLSTLPTSGSVPISPRSPQTGAPFDRLPLELYQLRIKIDQRLIASFPPSVSADIVRESSEGQRAGLARLLESRDRQDNRMQNLPVVVLTRGRDTSSELAATHAQLARLSKNSRHTVVPDAGHEIHLFAPSVVVQAILDVSAATRQQKQLPARP